MQESILGPEATTVRETLLVSHPLLLVVGSLNYDLIMRHDVLPRAGETVVGAVLTESCGGKGANQAVAAARFASSLGRSNPHIAFAGAVGRDLFGEKQVQQLQADGIDTTHIAVIEGVSTGTSTIWVDSASGENRILNAPGANLHLRPECLDSLPLEEAALLVLQNEIPVDTTRALCEQAAAHELPVLWDPAPFSAGSQLPLMPEQIRFITPNETEAAALLGRPLRCDEIEQDAAALQAMGFAAVIITLGAQGVVVASSDERLYRLPAPVVDAVDSTAAGDAFSGAFAASLIAGTDEEEAIRNGIAYASASVRHAGAQSSFPHWS